LRTDEVEEIEIATRSRTISFARSGSRFVFRDGASRVLDETETGRVEATLTNLLSFVSPSPWLAVPGRDAGVHAFEEDVRIRLTRADHSGGEAVHIHENGREKADAGAKPSSARVVLERELDYATVELPASAARPFAMETWTNAVVQKDATRDARP